MAKGYWMAHVDISDPDGYKLYQAANAEPFQQYGAKFFGRAGENQQVEGSVRSRHVIIEFPSYQRLWIATTHLATKMLKLYVSMPALQI